MSIEKKEEGAMIKWLFISVLSFFVLQISAVALCESFNIIPSPEEEYSEKKSSFRDNEELKKDSAVEYNEGLREQESSFRDSEELKEDSSLGNEELDDSVDYDKDLGDSVDYNEDLGDSVDYNEDL